MPSTFRDLPDDLAGATLVRESPPDPRRALPDATAIPARAAMTLAIETRAKRPSKRTAFLAVRGSARRLADGGESMSLEKPETIDLVGVSADGQTIILYLVATDPWPATGRGALLLQAKLKNYVAFAADGQLVRQYPEARGKNVVIEVRSDHPLGPAEQELVTAARDHWCGPEGIALVVSPGKSG